MTERGTRGSGRGRKRLTPQQEILLDRVRRADDAWREAKLTLKQRIRAQLEEELNRFSAARDAAVYAAVEGEVPKSRITTDGLRTSPNALYDAHARHAALVAEPGLPEVVEVPTDRFAIAHHEHPLADVYVLSDAENPHEGDLASVGLGDQPVDGWVFARLGDEWVPGEGYYPDIPEETWAWWLDNRPA